MFDWDTLRFFNKEEFGTRADELSPTLLLALDTLRQRIACPISIHPDPLGDEGRVTGSQHPLGTAVDCHAIGMDLGDFWLEAERLLVFKGIGLYPAWAHPGLHLDVRPGEVRARWWRDAIGTYHPLNAESLYNILDSHALKRVG